MKVLSNVYSLIVYWHTCNFMRSALAKYNSTMERIVRAEPDISRPDVDRDLLV